EVTAARIPTCAFAVAAAASLALNEVGRAADASKPIRGFAAASSEAETARERELASLLSPKTAEADFDVMTAEPHHVGSPYEIKLADYVADRFKEFGLEVSRYEYSVLVPWPGERRVEIVSPEPLTLHVEEEAIPGDPWAAKPGILPAYNAYS